MKPMKAIVKSSCLCTVLAAITSLTAQAQTLSTEITVDRTVDPVETAASPLGSVRPSVLRPAPSASTLHISDFGGDVLFGYMPDSVPPFISGGLPAPQSARGYATVAYFPAYRLGAQAGYNLVDNTNTLLSASAGFAGFSYHSHSGANRMTVSDNTVGLKAILYQKLGSHTLEAAAYYSHAALKSPTAAFVEQKQAFNSLRANLSVGRRTSRYSYKAEVDFDRLAASDPVECGVLIPVVLDPSADTYVRAALEGGLRTSDGRAGGELKLEAAHMARSGTELTLNPSGIILASDPVYSGSTILSVSPSFVFRNRIFGLRLGARLDFASGTGTGKFTVSPAVDAVWKPAGRFSVFVRMSGGTGFNTLRREYDYTPFAAPYTVSTLRRSPVNFMAGLRAGGTGGLRAGLSAGHTATDGAAMPVLSVGPLHTVAFLPVDLNCWWVELTAGYAAGVAGLDISGRVRLNQNGQEHADPDSPDRARLIASAEVSASPVEALKVGIGWDFRGGRKCPVLAASIASQSGSSESASPLPDQGTGLGNVSDLHISAAYDFGGHLSLGFEAHNLLCRRHDILPGLQSPALQALLSATIRF